MKLMEEKGSQIHLRAFGHIAEKMGENLTLDGIENIQELKQILLEKYPSLAGLKFAIAVNNQLCDNDMMSLKNNDTIAIMPPFSGG
jgi:molybdopterin converting factor small subunit